MTEVTELVQKISAKTGKKDNDVQQLIADKKAKFAGLLTEQGAAFLVAKELNVPVNMESYYGSTLKINQLHENVRNIDLKVKIKRMFPVREFESKGKKGLRCGLVVNDETGEINLTVWNERAQELNVLEVGTSLYLKGCYVSTYNNELQLNLGMNGQILIEGSEGGIVKKIGQLQENENKITVIGRLTRIFPIGYFENNGKKGKRLAFEIADETGSMYGIAWNELVDKLNDAREGQIVKLKNGYTQKGLKGNTEIHTDANSEVEVDPKIKIKIPLLKDLRKNVERKNIGQLIAGEKFKEIRAEIKKVERGRLFYTVCSKCRSKLDQSENNSTCSTCGLIEAPLKIPVISLTLADESGEITATFFERQAEQVMNMKMEELGKKLKEKTVEILMGEFNAQLVGKEIIATGSTRVSPFSQELEFTAREVTEIA